MERFDEKNSTAWLAVTERTVSFEGTAEISLPEYLGEVGRLLLVRPTVLPPAGFLSAGVAEYTGRISYRVLYVGTDGKLYGTEQEEGYTFTLPTEATGLDRISVLPEVDAVIARVLAPRKLSVRCRMRAEATGYAEEVLAPTLPEVKGELCYLGDMAEGGSFLSVTGEAVELSDEIAVEGEAPASVAFSHAELFMPEVVSRTGEVTCRGEAVLTLVCTREEGAPFSIVRRVPFTATVADERITAGAEARGFATATDLRAVIEEGRLLVGVCLMPVVEVQERVPVAYMKDAFLPGTRTVCQSSSKRIFTPGICRNVHFSISGTARAGECGLPAEAAVLAAVAEAEVGERRADERGISLSGDICCHLLYQSGEELCATQMTVPFSVRTEGAFEALSAKASVPICRVQRQGDVLRLDAELQVALRASESCMLTAVGSLEITPREDVPSCDVEICYPTRGETLFGVAKRYAVSPEELAIANGIADAGESGALDANYLLIPRYK